MALSVAGVVAGLSPTAHADSALAREHFKRGTAAYDLGHYDEAVQEYETAYRERDEPALLFNLAQAQRLGGHSAEAIRAYRAFLHRVPDSSIRPEVEARIVEMQKALDEQRKAKEGPPVGTIAPARAPAPSAPPPAPLAAPAIVDAPAPRPEPVPIYKRWWLWATVGVAAVAVGVGLGVGLSQSSTSYPSASTTLGTVRW